MWSTDCNCYWMFRFLQEASKKDLVWKIEKFHAAVLARHRTHLLHTNSLGKVCPLLSSEHSASDITSHKMSLPLIAVPWLSRAWQR